jgi:hypothetical protein
VVAVAVVALLIAASVILIVGICSPWISRVATFGICMSAELVVRAKGLFVATIVSIALVLVSLTALILISGRLLWQLAIVLTAGFWLSFHFLLFEFSVILKKVVNIFGRGV